MTRDEAENYAERAKDLIDEEFTLKSNKADIRYKLVGISRIICWKEEDDSESCKIHVYATRVNAKVESKEKLSIKKVLDSFSN